jgi:hypothetical protein
MNRLALAHARARRRQLDGEGGFALLFVLGITTMVVVLVGTALVVTASSVVPAVKSAYSQAADAAAQSGLQAFVAYLDGQCPSATSPADCAAHANLSNDSGLVAIPVPGASSGYTSTYHWHSYSTATYFRVESVGKVQQGGVAATRTVIGDVVPGASRDLLNYGMVTGFETSSSATALSDFQDHDIALDATAINAATVPIKGSVMRWGAASPGDAAGKVAVCNATYDVKGGRGNNPPPNAPNPYVDFTYSGLGGNNYTDFEPCHTSWGSYTKLLAPAHNAGSDPGGYSSNDALLLSNSWPGGPGPQFDQPVKTGWQYTTADSGVCSTVAGQNYRSFNLICAGYPVDVGGAPSDSSLYPNVMWQDPNQAPKLPTANPTIPDTACVYAGPTRIKFNNNDAQATVTSPGTTSSWVTSWQAAHPSAPAQCYTGASANGMAAQAVDLTGISIVRVADKGNVPSTTPAIAHGSSGWPVTGQKLGDTPSTSNSVFFLTNGTSGTTVGAPVWTNSATDANYAPAVNDNPSTKTDGAWAPQWTSFTNTGSCDATTGGLNFKFINCYMPKGSSADPYSWVKAQVKAAIAANPGNYTTAAQLQTLVNSYISQGNSSDAANNAPTFADYRSHRWSVTVTQGNGGGCTQATGVAGTATDTAITPPTSDSLFDNAAGNIHAAPSTDTTCFTATVTLQMGTCNVALVLGACVNVGNYVWGNGTALLGGNQKISQFTGTFTVKKTTTTTTTVAARSSFPAMNDITQYQMGFDGNGNGSNNTFGANLPGDLYIEGTVRHNIALVADDDVIITGSVGPNGANLATSDATKPNPEKTSDSDPASAIELVGRNNVRVYHPVRCKITDATQIANTSAGWCPNDITGLYTNVPAASDRPDQQYINLRPDLAGLTIYGAVFALGNAPAHIDCPQPPDGGGVCGGEFSLDNHNRGNALGYLTLVGSLGMAHHAPVGEEWPIADAFGATSRPYSGYQMAQQYLDLSSKLGETSGFPNPVDTTSSTGALWHIVSVSAAVSPPS